MTGPAKGVLKLDEQLCFALYSASRLVTRSYRPLLDKLDLTYPQYLVLMVLWEASSEGIDALTVGQVSQRLMLDGATMTPLLRRLEQRGFIDRRKSVEDQRSVLVSLTPRGLELENEAMQIPAALMCGREHQFAALLELRDKVRDFVAEMNAAAGD